MKAKDLKDLLSNVNDNAEILFDRYDHFLDEYECYDYRDLSRTSDGTVLIELKRAEADDDKTVENSSSSDDDSDEEELKTDEMLDDMMDSDFAAAM